MSLPSKLHTDQLILRLWEEDDLESFAKMNADPIVMKYFPSVLSRKDSDELAKSIQNHFDQYGFGFWAVEIPNITKFAGFIGLSVPAFEAHFTPCVEIGWRLKQKYWGQGYATEGAKVCLEFGLKQLRLKEIVSFTSIKNFPSRRVMEKLRMIHHTQDDFHHPLLPKDHPLSYHVLYRIKTNKFECQKTVINQE